MSLPTRSLLLLALQVAACSGGRDPILDRADELGAASGGGLAPGVGVPGTDGSPPPQPQAGDPPPQLPDEPPPVRPDEPPPGVPDQPAPADGADAQGGDPGSGPPAGPQVSISGTVTVPSWAGGPIRIDVFDGDQQAAAGQDGPRPGIVAVGRLDKPGPFTLQVSASVDQVWVGGFVDEDRDGRPGHNDPSGWYAGNPVKTGADVGDITLSLSAPLPPPEE
jgi:hypothetical protein